MRKRLYATAVTLAAGATMALSSPAMAAPPQNGLVNVSIGDVTVLQDVGIGVAANVLANVCGVQVNAAVIAEQVIRNDAPLVGECTAQNDAPFMIST